MLWWALSLRPARICLHASNWDHCMRTLQPSHAGLPLHNSQAISPELQINFGEFPAFFTLGGLMLEYALGMAAIARGFSRFVARLCNVSPSLFLVELWQCPPGFTVNAADVVTTPRGFKVPAIGICTVAHSFDFMAAAIVMIITGLLSLGVQRSTLFISSEKQLN